jgi:hypothetical protein
LVQVKKLNHRHGRVNITSSSFLSTRLVGQGNGRQVDVAVPGFRGWLAAGFTVSSSLYFPFPLLLIDRSIAALTSSALPTARLPRFPLFPAFPASTPAVHWAGFLLLLLPSWKTGAADSDPSLREAGVLTKVRFVAQASAFIYDALIWFHSSC